jgi:predicted Zn-dependent protease with MMP-like domain
VEEADFDFERAVQEVVDSLPDQFRDAMSNLENVVEDEPPPGRRLLGLYQGIPLTRRTHWYAFALPDKISIYRGPIARLSGGDPARLTAEVRRVVLHELAHHFGISDERLLELGRY